MKPLPTLLSVIGLGLVTHRLIAAESSGAPGNLEAAARAVNALGADLLVHGPATDANALLSPYSIQTALAMSFAGAAGDTRAEMAKVLHYVGDEAGLHRSFAALRQAIEEVAGGKEDPGRPVTLTVANRLFGQTGYAFRAPFLDLLKHTYGAPLQPMDFVREAAGATQEINAWVEEQTRRRIRDLVPPDTLDASTRLVLVNAVYLKAPWAEEFPAQNTKPRPFHIGGGPVVEAPTMLRQDYFGYARREGFSAVTLPYRGGEIQFLVLLPHETNGLAAVEASLTPELLASCVRLRLTEVILYLPKLKLELPVLRLGKVLQSLGMKSAFDQPRGTANFERMAPRKPNDYPYISEVFHQTFLALDEKGTEAAAATAAEVLPGANVGSQPVELRVDHPFLFAIQHRSSGACLFLGRITDPR